MASQQGQQSLTTIALLWPTPSAHSDPKGAPSGSQIVRRDGSIQSRETGGTLAYMAEQRWPTPRAHEVGGYQYSKGDKTKPVPTLTGMASSLPDREISTDGDGSSRSRRSLNPLFVEWLMGWPRGWTLLSLTPPASSASVCSATALSLWKARMRSALSQLASPPAPPAQLSLLG
jgi:hypothetical protein